MAFRHLYGQLHIFLDKLNNLGCPPVPYSAHWGWLSPWGGYKCSWRLECQDAVSLHYICKWMLLFGTTRPRSHPWPWGYNAQLCPFLLHPCHITMHRDVHFGRRLAHNGVISLHADSAGGHTSHHMLPLTKLTKASSACCDPTIATEEQHFNAHGGGLWASARNASSNRKWSIPS